MKCIIIESPFSAQDERIKERHLLYLARCVYDCINRNEAPFASHGFYTLYLNDDRPLDRALGIEAGLAWTLLARRVAFYVDYGMSTGMLGAELFYKKSTFPFKIKYRKIGVNPVGA